MFVENDTKTDSLHLDLSSEDLADDTAHVVGVAILIPGDVRDGPAQQKLLVVKRAAHEDQFPDMWEIPGGHIEAGETIREAIVRETFEETGLEIDAIVGRFEDLRWTSLSSGRQNVQYNYVVSAQHPLRVRLNDEEHSQHLWASETEINSLPCSEGMRKMFSDAFKFAREQTQAS